MIQYDSADSACVPVARVALPARSPFSGAALVPCLGAAPVPCSGAVLGPLEGATQGADCSPDNPMRAWSCMRLCASSVRPSVRCPRCPYSSTGRRRRGWILFAGRCSRGLLGFSRFQVLPIPAARSLGPGPATNHTCCPSSQPALRRVWARPFVRPGSVWMHFPGGEQRRVLLEARPPDQR